MSEKERISRALQLIRDNEALERDLFRKLAHSGNPIAWLIPLRQSGYLSAKKNPPPQQGTSEPESYWCSTWHILGYLENLARKNHEERDEDATQILLEIVDEVATFELPTGERVDNWQTDHTILEIICVLPPGELVGKHINYARTFLQSRFFGALVSNCIVENLLPRLLDDADVQLVLQLLDIILDCKKLEGAQIRKYDSTIEEHWLAKGLKKNGNNIARLCGFDAAKVALKKIQAIIERDEGEFNYIQIPAIENHEQNRFRDEYESQLVYFVRDMLEISDAGSVYTLVGDLLHRKHPIFKRLAIHLAGNRYETLSDHLWNMNENPLDLIDLKRETYRFLEINSSKFDRENISRVLEWVESSQYQKLLKDEGSNELAACDKKEWLTPLLASKDAELKKLYEECNVLCPHDATHPGFSVWSDPMTRIISGDPGYTFDAKSPKEIATDMCEHYSHPESDEPGNKVPPHEFENYVASCPKLFLDAIDVFKTVPREYHQGLIRGISDAWKSGAAFPVKTIISFISWLLKDGEFWDESHRKHYNFRNWIVKDIGRLISVGTSDDSHAFPEEHFGMLESLILTLLKKAESTADRDHLGHDLVNDVLNSPRGEVYEAAIQFSLRYARVTLKEEPDKWKASMRDAFTAYLTSHRDREPDLSVTIARFLPNLLFLDRQWVERNLDQIFSQDDSIWAETMSSYLFYSSAVYGDIYKLLRDHGDYRRALAYQDFDEESRSKLIQHICVAYFERWELLEDNHSLITLVLERYKPRDILEIAGFISRQGGIGQSEEKIRALWPKLLKPPRVIEHEREYFQILSELSTWISLVKELDEESFEWLMASAPYVSHSYKEHDFVRGLQEHAQNHPVMTGKLYEELLSAGQFPTYEQDEIKAIVRILFEKGQDEAARRICNKYISAGIEFLRDIFDEYCETE